MKETFFRKKSLERISSPEVLNDCLQVTGPAVWLILTAVILLFAGILIWSSAARIDSYVPGTAQVQDGSMYIQFEDSRTARSVESGMTVTAGEAESKISSVGTDAQGNTFAIASTTLKDGTYSVKVIFRRTQVLSLLFE